MNAGDLDIDISTSIPRHGDLDFGTPATGIFFYITSEGLPELNLSHTTSAATSPGDWPVVVVACSMDMRYRDEVPIRDTDERYR